VQLELNPVSGGPYVMTKRVRGQELVLQRRDDYFQRDGKQIRPMPYFKEVRFRVIEDSTTSVLALRAGEIDETEILPEQWVTEQTSNDEFYERNTKVTGPEWVSFHFCWNCSTPYFSDRQVRWAMSYAFDHDEMLGNILYGLYQPASGPFHETSWMAPRDYPPPVTQNLDKAEALLDEAGWQDSDGDGIRDKEIEGNLIPFEFTVICGQDPSRIKICELLRQNLDQIGVVCHVRPLEFTVLQQMSRDHKFHAAMAGWGTGTDPDTSINIYGTGENRNYGLYSNKEVDDLFQQGRRVFDKAERAAVYARMHQVLFDDQAYTWLYWRNSFYGFNKELRGYKFSPRGPFSYDPGFSSFWKAL
jgi:peptide/nickel transport system substrate-binding protein